MRAVAGAVAVIAALSACRGGDAPAAAPAAPRAVAHVTERIPDLHGQPDVTMSYDVAIEPAADGGQDVTVAGFHDLREVDAPVEGRVLAAHFPVRALGAALALGAIRFHVDRAGRVTRTDAVDDVRAQADRGRAIAPEVAAAARRITDDPTLQRALVAGLEDRWIAWAGLWSAAGAPPAAGRVRAFEAYDRRIELRTLGPGDAGTVRVEARTERPWNPTDLGDPIVFFASLDHAKGYVRESYGVTLTADLDPATHRPRHVEVVVVERGTDDGRDLPIARDEYDLRW